MSISQLKCVIVFISIISVPIVSVQAGRTKVTFAEANNYKSPDTVSVSRKNKEKKHIRSVLKKTDRRQSTRLCKRLISTGEDGASSSFKNTTKCSPCLNLDDVHADAMPSGFCSPWVWYVTTLVEQALRRNRTRCAPRVTLNAILDATKDPALSIVAKATYRSVFYTNDVRVSDYDRHLVATWLDLLMRPDLNWKEWLADSDSPEYSLVWERHNSLYDFDLDEETEEMRELARRHNIPSTALFCGRKPVFFRSHILWMLVVTLDNTQGKALLPAVGGITDTSGDGFFSEAAQDILCRCFLVQNDCLSPKERIILEFWVDYYCSMISWTEWRSRISDLVFNVNPEHPVSPESYAICQNETYSNPSGQRLKSRVSEQSPIPGATTANISCSRASYEQSDYSTIRLCFQVKKTCREAGVISSPRSTLRQKKVAVTCLLMQDMLEDVIEIQCSNK